MEANTSWLIVGLGNPGRKYLETRHNAGFVALDVFLSSIPSNNPIVWKSKFSAEYAEVSWNGVKIIALKPQTYMNLSGEAVIQAAHFYKIDPQTTIVLHDEIDLPLGSVKLKKGGGDAGHNGLKSISQHLGTQDYIRLRIGVGRPTRPTTSEITDEAPPPIAVSDWVLGRFDSSQKAEFEASLALSAQIIQQCLTSGFKDSPKSNKSLK